MLTTKEARKIPYEQLDEESKEYYYQLFKKYVVRKQIADNNKVLASLFASGGRSSMARNFSGNFNLFNSTFVGSDLIKHLNYHEIHTDYLSEMSEDRFNFHLHERGNDFYRKIALICFSGRKSERIPNRVEYPVMVAYANMQSRVLSLSRKYPNEPMYRIFENSAEHVRNDFYEKNNYRISQSEILQERVDYKSIGKKHAPIWKSMMQYYRKHIKDLPALEAAAFVRDNFVFTEQELERYDRVLNQAMHRAYLKLVDDRDRAQEIMDTQPDYYNPADYDEVFSRNYAEEVYFDVMENSIVSIFDKYLSDPIYAEKEPKENKQKTEE